MYNCTDLLLSEVNEKSSIYRIANEIFQIVIYCNPNITRRKLNIILIYISFLRLCKSVIDKIQDSYANDVYLNHS